MVVVLFFGLPAFVLSPVALTLSVLPRPWDPALLVLNGLLLLVVAAMFFDFRDVATGVILLSAYLLGSLALGLRCLVSKWELRRT